MKGPVGPVPLVICLEKGKLFLASLRLVKRKKKMVSFKKIFLTW